MKHICTVRPLGLAPWSEVEFALPTRKMLHDLLLLNFENLFGVKRKQRAYNFKIDKHFDKTNTLQGSVELSDLNDAKLLALKHVKFITDTERDLFEIYMMP